MKRKDKPIRVCTILSLVALLLIPVVAFAGGGQHYPNGVESFLVGVAPPPGFYLKEYNYFYTASEQKGDRGQTLFSHRDGVDLDKLNVYGVIPRFIWISNQKILGGFFGMHLFVPLIRADLRLDAAAPGTAAGHVELHDKRTGVYDLIFSPFIWSWHAQNGLLHIVTALDLFIPSGPYNKNDLVNIGKNFWTFEPVFALTAFLPQDKNLSASIKLMYDFNTRNGSYIVGPVTAAQTGNPSLAGQDTYIDPGQEFHFDYSIDYQVVKDLRLGIGGYFYQQVTNDRTGGATVRNDKGRVFAIGPGIWYSHKNWIFDFHTAFETAVKNRPQGVTSLFNITYAFGK